MVDDVRQSAKPDDSLLPKGVPSFSSANIMPGKTYRRTFTKPGRYRYFCASHELDGMVGEIIVRPRPVDTAPVFSQSSLHGWKNLARSTSPSAAEP